MGIGWGLLFSRANLFPFEEERASVSVAFSPSDRDASPGRYWR